MSNKTKIEWTEATWNPITGCSKVSAGCEHCYAETMAKRLKAMGNPRYFNGFQVTIHKDLFTAPLSWKKPRMIFVNSMSDIFHEQISDEDILALFNTMSKASWHTFQVLTKRIDRLNNLAPKINWSDNIWMGCSIENQDTIPRSKSLVKCGAKTKFISAEPLLQSLNGIELENIDWIIVGGESGYGCRPMEKEWVLEIKDLAERSNTAFFFKQWGGFNRKKNGDLLDDKEYKEYPKNI